MSKRQSAGLPRPQNFEPTTRIDVAGLGEATPPPAGLGGTVLPTAGLLVLAALALDGLGEMLASRLAGAEPPAAGLGLAL